MFKVYKGGIMQKILVILGSTRPTRRGIKVAEWLKTVTAQYSDMEFDFVDLAQLDLPFLQEPQSASSGIYEYETTKAWSKRVAGADGYIIITPEYNHSFPGVLKNALDHLYHEWNRKPVAFVGYGGHLGVRSVDQLRLVACGMEMATVYSQVEIDIFAQVDENGNFTATPKNDAQAKRMLDELKWWAQTLSAGRSKN